LFEESAKLKLLTMKYLLSLTLGLALATDAVSQCTSQGDGIAISTPITIDGDVSDWSAVINDQDNFSLDAIPDMDAPIADVGRNFTKFAFTETWSTLYLYFARAGSATNAVDALLYIDVNNNSLMETNEPVIAISWSGANGNGKVDIYNYVQANAGGDVVSGDGVDMPGSLLLRNTLGTIGRGTSDGLALEVGIPFPQIYKQGSSDPIDMLAPNEQFKFHLSTINGSPTSVPGPNAINDNFNGCYAGLMILPVDLEYFASQNKKAGVVLSWKINGNENAATFEIEASEDGQHFEKIGVVSASNTEGNQEYVYHVAANTGVYYRLKLIDDKGAFQYSKILSINSGGGQALTIKVTNPVYSDVTIWYESKAAEIYNIRIFDIAGLQVYSKAVSIHSGSNKIMISSAALKASGSYLLQMSDRLNHSITHKLVKL
jgi:hypothetical protein